MGNNTVKKPVWIIITPQPETAEKYTKEYHLFFKLHVLLLADMLKSLEMNSEILLNNKIKAKHYYKASKEKLWKRLKEY